MKCRTWLDNSANIKVNGNNNFINLIEIVNEQYRGDVAGDYNKVSVGKKSRWGCLWFGMPDNYNYRELSIEDDSRICDCHFILLGNNRKIHVGKNCMFSWGIYIKTTDQHPVYDLKTNERINAEQDVFIGDNVWIGQDAYVSKGSVIPSGCIVGAKSFVNKAFTKENCIIAGIPAKVVKENIHWEVE